MLNLRSLPEFNQMQAGFILVIVQSKSIEAIGYVSLKPRREVDVGIISKQSVSQVTAQGKIIKEMSILRRGPRRELRISSTSTHCWHGIFAENNACSQWFLFWPAKYWVCYFTNTSWVITFNSYTWHTCKVFSSTVSFIFTLHIRINR